MNAKTLSFFLTAFLCLAISTICFADVRLPSLISDNMVLQADTNAPIWGWAQPDEQVKVVLGDLAPVETIADKTGKWLAKIKTPKAGGPYEMTVSGKNILLVKNIMFGEVWVCSGQSNMEMPIASKTVYYTGIMNWEQEVLAANLPQIRLFKVDKKVAQSVQNDCCGSWAQCAPATAADFSAVAYFFGADLYKKLNVPIGLIQSAWGGTPVESWMKKQVLESDPDFEPILKHFDEAVINYPQAVQEYLQKMKEWKKVCEQARAQKQKLPMEPFLPLGPTYYRAPSVLYNAMIAPLLPYGIRGVIWYQGESNAERPYQYRKLFPAMIKNWRTDWGQGDFPFYYVQIAPCSYKNWSRPMYTPELREAQLMALSLPNTGMAVTMDIGDVNDVHPRNKQEVGRRLALWALAKTYGYTDIVYSGPIYKSMKIKGNKIRLYFDHIGTGLLAKDGSLRRFIIAGEDKNFVDAKAVIDGDTVIVSSDKVLKPVAVRYGWNNAAQPNLFNKEGLPASPFRTDNWFNSDADRK
jgi:sialate O-acetylesterase